MEVEAKQILCGGCNEWKKLGKDYEIKNWDTHKSKCHGITGTQNKRVFHGLDKFVEVVSIFIFELRFCWCHLHVHSSLPAQDPLHRSSNLSSVANPHLGRHRVLWRHLQQQLVTILTQLWELTHGNLVNASKTCSFTKHIYCLRRGTTRHASWVYSKLLEMESLTTQRLSLICAKFSMIAFIANPQTTAT